MPVPLDVVIGVEDWWVEKFARRAEVSSVLDFSKKGRLITEGFPDIVFLWVISGGWCWDGCQAIRGGQYELHGGE